MERLDKRLSSTGRWSRKEARELIRAGRVRVDGQVVRAPEEKVGRQVPVMVDGEDVGGGGPVYLMMNKPAGLVSATEDPRQETVLSLLPERYRRLGLFPAGRLDKDTEGLLLLTNDGPLAHRLLAPKNHVDKVYYLEVDGALDEADCRVVAEGMTLPDGLTCLPGKLEPFPGENRGYITIREGKYHQIKRMMEALGKPVTYLKRVRFGPLTLDETLEKGGWRALTEEEIRVLFGQ
ncbi:MAG TPA: 16S rRNA pseudouridine(516) synthase [Candidatus Enterenecus stercoripullorum]|nr:16S rRNA pseudouridine(516) synthase [Candidatus Enterenecus stercoripullorum]